jgi:hypothetical protein
VPIALFCDNQGAIRLIQNPEFHCHTKHVEVVYHYVHEQFASGRIDVSYIPTEAYLRISLPRL